VEELAGKTKIKSSISKMYTFYTANIVGFLN